MLGNRRMSARDLADAAGISINLSVPFFTDILGLKYIRSRLVPKQFFQKERRVKICEEMLYDYKLVMKRIITGNVTWIYAYYPKTSDQYREYRAKGQAKPKRSHQSKSKIKATLTVLSDYCGVLWADNSWFLQRNNAPSHTFDAYSYTTTVFAWFNNISLLATPETRKTAAGKSFWDGTRDPMRSESHPGRHLSRIRKYVGVSVLCMEGLKPRQFRELPLHWLLFGMHNKYSLVFFAENEQAFLVNFHTQFRFFVMNTTRPL